MNRAQAGAAALIGLLLVGLLGGLAWFLFGPRAAQAVEGSATPAPTALMTASASPSPSAGPLPTPTDGAPAPIVLATPTDGGPLSCLPANAGETGQVLEVLADATLRVNLGGRTAEVRLMGADPAGPPDQTAALLRELTAGKTVRLLRDAEDSDSAGRLLRYVLAGDDFLNYILVRRGAALPALYPPGQLCGETMLAAEALARAEKLGYWSQAAAGSTAQAAEQVLTPGLPPCDCTRTYACTDFNTRNAAQACYDACGDYRNVTLDDDNDGLACENMP
jgi:endonuclease YncB( thermonuclease family)